MSVRWGIDPSTQRVAIGVVRRRLASEVRADEPLPETGPAVPFTVLCARERAFEQFGAGKSAQRLLHACVASQELMRGLLEDFGRPEFVVWERPFGGNAGSRKVHVESHYIIAAITIAAASVCGPTTRVLDLPPQSWKSRAGLGGRAEKAEIMAWASALLPDVLLTQDEADALGLAVAALTIN